MRTFLSTLILLFSISLTAQDLKNYQLYNQQLRKVTFDKMVKELTQYDIVLFGEHHNNAVNHWLQLRLTKALYEKKKEQLVLGAEMFERHQQESLTNYLNGNLNEKEFKQNTKLWSNYSTDYEPLVNFAKEHHLPFIATNVTRKYASYVAKNGLSSLDTISDQEKKYIAQLPIFIDYKAPGYPEMIEMMGAHSGERAKQFVAAQALKDATMAESILNQYKTGYLFLHFNGDYHSKNYGGIYWYLNYFQPPVKKN